MTSKGDKKKSLKSRSRLRRSGRGRGLPRIMWVAIAVCIIGAVLIFREQGGQMPTGIGEYQSVVTADQEGATLQDQNGPRSGDVDISDQTTTLTPEKPTGDSGPTEEATPAKPAVKKTTTPKPANTKPKPAPVLIMPSTNGPYLVQVGSFGNVDNANKEANRL